MTTRTDFKCCHMAIVTRNLVPHLSARWRMCVHVREIDLIPFGRPALVRLAWRVRTVSSWLHMPV